MDYLSPTALDVISYCGTTITEISNSTLITQGTLQICQLMYSGIAFTVSKLNLVALGIFKARRMVYCTLRDAIHCIFLGNVVT